MSELVLDAARSRVRIHTFAEGLLARLAHDLELVCEDLSGSASRGNDGGTAAGVATIVMPLRGITVRGAVGSGGRIDEHALSPSDRRDILEKMRTTVFHARAEDDAVHIEATLEAGCASVRIRVPHGSSLASTVRPEVRMVEDALHSTGTFEVSLAALGSDVLKGPMGAFRVKDRVRISFDLVFAPPQPA